MPVQKVKSLIGHCGAANNFVATGKREGKRQGFGYSQQICGHSGNSTNGIRNHQEHYCYDLVSSIVGKQKHKQRVRHERDICTSNPS